MQGMTSDDPSRVAVSRSSTSETSASPPSYALVAVNYENTVSVLHTPPWMKLTDDSPPELDETASQSGVTTGSYRAVPVSEPDLTKVPERSALKGGKTRQLEEKQRGQENQHEVTSLPRTPKTSTSPPCSRPAAVQFGSTGVLPRVPPKVAPKPRIGP